MSFFSFSYSSRDYFQVKRLLQPSSLICKWPLEAYYRDKSLAISCWFAMSWNKSVVIDRHACAYSIEIDYSQSLLPGKLDSIASLYELIMQLIILFSPSFGLDMSFIFYKSKPLKKCIYFLLMEIDVEWNNYHWIY